MKINGEDLAQKLNNIVSDFKLDFKHGRLNFYFGDYIKQTLEILSTYCSCGKIATLYFNSTYQELGKQFSNALKSKGFKPLSVIMPEDFSDSIDDYARLFTLPEDVRAIITFDTKLNQSIKYYGAIKNIETIHVLRDVKSVEFISPKILVKNGNKIQPILLNCNQHVIIDQENCEISLPKIYAYVVSKTVSLIDYKIHCKLNSKKYIKNSYDLLNTAIGKSLSCFNSSVDNRGTHLIESLFSTEMANRLSDGELWLCSSENSVNLLMKNFNGYDRIMFLKYILGLYKKFFSGDYEHLLDIPDYNSRALYLSKELDVDENYIMQNLLSQIERYKLSQDKVAQFKKLLFTQIDKAEKLVSQINSTYHALGGGGRESKNLKTSIFYAGDVTSTLNGVSLLRESGILEYLEV